MPDPAFISVVNQTSFDWMSFFWGGAVGSFIGALIILSIERIFDYIVAKIKFHSEKRQITNAFNVELENNLRICNYIIDTLSEVPNGINIFSKFDFIWLDKFLTLYIDFTCPDSLRLYSFLYGVKSLMGRFESSQQVLLSLSTSSRALSNFPILVNSNNQSMLKISNELKGILVAIKKIRKDNKIFFEDVKEMQSVQST